MIARRVVVVSFVLVLFSPTTIRSSLAAVTAMRVESSLPSGITVLRSS